MNDNLGRANTNNTKTNKYHIGMFFKPYDLRIGFFLDKPAKSFYICLVPMLPIKIWATEHVKCPTCGEPMQKTAIDVSPDGYDLQWICETCEKQGDETTIEIDWNMDFKGCDWITRKDLLRMGYVIE